MNGRDPAPTPPGRPPELGPPAYVVLGMVGLGARSGYEIKRRVELSIRFFWTISHAQIYPSLELLEQAGLISGRSEPTGKRPRRVFEITPRGELVLKEWLSSGEPIPFELRDTGLLKLFFADALDRSDALTLLGAVKRRSEERVAALRAIAPEAERAALQGDSHPLLTLQMGIAFHEAIIDVAGGFAPRLAASAAGNA
jgi:DNA-binding PadR family transcriptional regulator